MHTLPKAAAKCRRRPPPMVPETLTVKSMVGRVHPSESTAIGTPADEFCHVVAIQSLALKKHIMQVPAFTTCYVRSQSAQAAGRVATGFPLPSTGRGIEGEGWSSPEPPPVRFFLYQPHPGSRLNT